MQIDGAVIMFYYFEGLLNEKHFCFNETLSNMASAFFFLRLSHVDGANDGFLETLFCTDSNPAVLSVDEICY